MWEYNHYPNSDELYHHGIMGMHWGKRNGPPYPLGASDHSSSEKKAGWRKSLDRDGKVATVKKNKKQQKKADKDYKQAKKEVRNEHRKNLRQNINEKMVGEKIMSGKGTSHDYKKARGKVIAGALLATAAVGGATYVALRAYNKKSISAGAAATRHMMKELSRNNMTVVNGTIVSKKPHLVGDNFVTFKPDTFAYDTFKYATFKPD